MNRRVLTALFSGKWRTMLHHVLLAIISPK